MDDIHILQEDLQYRKQPYIYTSPTSTWAPILLNNLIHIRIFDPKDPTPQVDGRSQVKCTSPFTFQQPLSGRRPQVQNTARRPVLGRRPQFERGSTDSLPRPLFLSTTVHIYSNVSTDRILTRGRYPFTTQNQQPYISNGTAQGRYPFTYQQVIHLLLKQDIHILRLTSPRGRYPADGQQPFNYQN